MTAHRQEVLARVRDILTAPRELRLEAARRLIESGECSTETLELLYAESERVDRARDSRRLNRL